MARTHGTAGRYAEGCKCDVCTDENTRRNDEGRMRRALVRPIPPEVEHGASCYRNWACDCDVCVQGNRALLNARINAAGPGENRRKEWTEKELRIATEKQEDGRRYARTAFQVAVKLKRSVSAVNKQRADARVNPERVLAAPAE